MPAAAGEGMEHHSTAWGWVVLGWAGLGWGFKHPLPSFEEHPQTPLFCIKDDCRQFGTPLNEGDVPMCNLRVAKSLAEDSLLLNSAEEHMLENVSQRKPSTVSEESKHGRTLFA